MRACYDSLGAEKAPGVDGVTKAEYGKNLEENLQNLSAQLKRMGYRPAPKRRSYVPKEGICFEGCVSVSFAFLHDTRYYFLAIYVKSNILVYNGFLL